VAKFPAAFLLTQLVFAFHIKLAVSLPYAATGRARSSKQYWHIRCGDAHSAS
jgi:hypothetical protein